MHLCVDSYIGRDSNKEFIYVYGGTHKVSSYMSMEEFIGRE